MCLVLAALTLEDKSVRKEIGIVNTVSVLTYQSGGGASTMFKIVQEMLKRGSKEDGENEKEREELKLDIDIQKLVDVYLLGKRKRLQRVVTAYLLKALWDRDLVSHKDMLSIFTSRLP